MSDEESNNVKLNEDIPTSCNEAYGVAGVSGADPGKTKGGG